jgi:serine/threonine protein kinase
MRVVPTTVKDFTTLITRSRLMTEEQLRRALAQFTGDAENLDGVKRFLVGQHHLTEYQCNLLSRGHSEGFFLANYKILDLIAKGNFAGVYKAQHESGRIVAIKVLPSSKAKDSDTLKRFQQEAKLLIQLDHPNVVRAFELSEDDGKCFLVMEFLDGETLEQLLEHRKKLPPAEAGRIILQALTGLQHLHTRGLIHRDLKPSNLMLVKGEGEGTTRVKILDIGFGKSVYVNPDEVGQTGQTAERILGTPDYLAPEQAKSANKADIRSDIYSLGCVFYRALTGQPPFPDSDVLKQLARHAKESPRPLSDFLQGVPEGLQQLLDQMMAKDPAQRFATPELASQAMQKLSRPATAASTSSKITPTSSQLPDYLKSLQAAELESKPSVPGVKTSTSSEKQTPAKHTVPPAQAKLPTKSEIVTAPKSTNKSDLLPKLSSSTESKKVPIASATEIDVELVSLEPSADARGLIELNRRDVIMLCAGGGLVFSAVCGAWGLSRLLRRPSHQETQDIQPPPSLPEGEEKKGE